MSSLHPIKVEIRFKYKITSYYTVMSCVCLCFFLSPVSHCQQITLSSYYTPSTCVDGCVNVRDRVIFHCIIDISRAPDKNVILNYDIKRKHQLRFENLCHLVIPAECQDNPDSYCFCTSMSKPGHYQAYINMSAQVDNSQAFIRGELVYPQMSLYSEIQSLPKIYDLNLNAMKLYIADQLVNINNCSFSTNETNVVLVADCVDSCPCMLTIMDAVSGKKLKYKADRISHFIQAKDKAEIKLKYEMCHISKTVHCFITKEIVNTSDRTEEKDLLQLIWIALVIPLTVIIVFITKIILKPTAYRVKKGAITCIDQLLKKLNKLKDYDDVTKLLQATSLLDREWQMFTFWSDKQRYSRNLIYEEVGKFQLFLIHWQPRQGYDPHKLLDSCHLQDYRCFFKVLHGTIVETYFLEANSDLSKKTDKEYENGDISDMGDCKYFHCLTNPNEHTPAVTLHVYIKLTAHNLVYKKDGNTEINLKFISEGENLSKESPCQIQVD